MTDWKPAFGKLLDEHNGSYAQLALKIAAFIEKVETKAYREGYEEGYEKAVAAEEDSDD